MTSLDTYAEIIKSGRVYIIGNGGSYANALHIANDLLACGIPAFTLDASTLTASANDFGYETVFARWIETVGNEGDVLVALSGSGRSSNILKAIHVAEKKGMEVIFITDYLRNMDMQQSEEAQVKWGHEIMKRLRDR